MMLAKFDLRDRIKGGNAMHMRRLGTEINYPYDWMDEAIEITLNPEVSEVDKIPADQLARLRQRFAQESAIIWKDLNNIIFAVPTPEQISLIVRLHNTAIRLLQDQAKRNMESYKVHETLISTGNEILLILKTLKWRLDLRYVPFLHEHVKEKNLAGQTTGKPKLTCTLTVDQIGLILKAADESQLIISSSLSMIFKTIVPYLATEVKSELSWDSMRSNSYHPEQRDKEAAIAALKKLIIKIQDSL
jgi:hypothetical protein